MKTIGFTDGSGSPTDLWKEARTGLGSAMAKGIKAGYGSLYQTYPNAHQQSNEAIKNFFKANSAVGDAAVSKMVSTFKALVGIADFGAVDSAPSGQSPDLHQAPSVQVSRGKPQGAGGVNLTLNIELQVPSDPTGEVYDKFFAAMKKHLIDVDA